MSRRRIGRPLWRRLRSTVSCSRRAAIVVIALAWNVYVSFHNGGLIHGKVADANGNPLPGADVVLLVQNVTTFSEKARTRTGPDGGFMIEGNSSHRVQILAESPTGRSARVELRLWFRGQNTALKQPLIIVPREG